MKNKKEILKKTIGIDYLQGMMTDEDIHDMEAITSQEGITLTTTNHPSKHIAGFEKLFPQMMVFLSSDLAIGIYAGLIANGLCVAIKKLFVVIKEKTQNKRCTKLQGAIIEENVLPTIHVIIGDVHVILPVNITDEQYALFVDNLFEAIKEQNITKQTYCIYKAETNEFQFLSKEEIVWNEHQKSNEE